jgi:hypothetical protein
MSGVADTVSEYASDVGEYASDIGERVYETASSYASTVSGYAEDMTRRATRLSRRAQSSAGQMLHEQPLAVAALGLASGAAIAALLPRTEVERRTMRPAREALSDAASWAADSVREAAGEAGRRLQEGAAERGLSADGMKDLAREAAEAFTGSISGGSGSGSGSGGSGSGSSGTSSGGASGSGGSGSTSASGTSGSSGASGGMGSGSGAAVPALRAVAPVGPAPSAGRARADRRAAAPVQLLAVRARALQVWAAPA